MTTTTNEFQSSERTARFEKMAARKGWTTEQRADGTIIVSDKVGWVRAVKRPSGDILFAS